MSPTRSPRRDVLPTFRDRSRIRGIDVPVGHFILGPARDPRVVTEAYERGINAFLVTSDLHWPAFEGTREGLRRLFERPGARESVVVIAISYMTLPGSTAEAFRELLRAVPELGYIDAIVAGGVTETNFFPLVRDYRSHVVEGLVGARAWGMCFDGEFVASIALRADVLDLALVPYGPVGSDARLELLDAAVGRNAAALAAFAPAYHHADDAALAKIGLAEDMWRPEPVDYIRYALSSAAMGFVTLHGVGSSDLDDLERGLEAGPLDDEEMQYIDDLADVRTGRARIDTSCRGTL